MKKLVLLFISTLLVISVCLAHGEEKVGILIDAKCGEGLAAKPAGAAEHTIACVLKCKDSGFGIISGGKFWRFDEYGNRQAHLLLKSTELQANLKVRVGGHFEGDLIKVGEIETVD